MANGKKSEREGCEIYSKSKCERKFLCRWSEDDKKCKTNPLPFLFILGAAAVTATVIITGKKKNPTIFTDHWECISGFCQKLPGPGDTLQICQSKCIPGALCRDPGAENYLKPLPCIYGGGKCLDPLAINYGKDSPCVYLSVP